MANYCPSCGTHVLTVEKNSDHGTISSCAYCGLVLSPAISRPVAELAKSRAPAKQASGTSAGNSRKPSTEQVAASPGVWKEGIEIGQAESGTFVVESLSDEPIMTVKKRGQKANAEDLVEEPPPVQTMFTNVVVVEDTALLREIVKDALEQNGISKEVRGCKGGEDFLQAATEQLVARIPLDLVILDVEMPVLNGYATAVALRALERGIRVRPVPIVFFTARACDETFRKVLEYCQPARYLNKGVDSEPPRIAARLVQVLAGLKR